MTCNRRTAASLLAAAPLAMTTASSAAMLQSLKPSPRLPVLFLGHGSPMNAIEDNAYRRSWQALGAELLAKHGAHIQLVLCISAHWVTDDWAITVADKPRTIHDFGGFPQALFDERYGVPGSPAVATQIAKGLAPTPIELDDTWGLDHGAWSVLKPMFPNGNIPVLQLSLHQGKTAGEHFAIGQQLRSLRERGVLIVGSGNGVHNLRVMNRNAKPTEAFDWAFQFDEFVAKQVRQGSLDGLASAGSLGPIAQIARLAHPTLEHYLPLLHAAGAVHNGEPARMFNTDFAGGSIAMRSVVWG